MVCANDARVRSSYPYRICTQERDEATGATYFGISMQGSPALVRISAQLLVTHDEFLSKFSPEDVRLFAYAAGNDASRGNRPVVALKSPSSLKKCLAKLACMLRLR